MANGSSPSPILLRLGSYQLQGGRRRAVRTWLRKLEPADARLRAANGEPRFRLCPPLGEIKWLRWHGGTLSAIRRRHRCTVDVQRCSPARLTHQGFIHAREGGLSIMGWGSAFLSGG
jgi:hypothetical protein